MEHTSTTPANGAELVALIANLAASGCFLVVVLNGCRSGFDFTDEAYYLNWISDPWRYSASVSQFGFLYHPLYRLVGGDVVLLRQTGIAFSLALAVVLCICVLRGQLRGFKAGGSRALWCVTGVAAVVATTSLSFLSVWLPSPSYNSLNFQSVLLFAIGMGCLQSRSCGASVGAWGIIAIAVSVSFLTKPPTAALLTILACGYLVIVERSKTAMFIFATVAGVVLVAAAFEIDGSIAVFLKRIVSGARLIDQLQGDRSFLYVFNWSGFGWTRFHVLTFVLIVPLTWLLIHRTLSSVRSLQATVSIAFAVIALAIMTGSEPLRQFGKIFHPIQLLAVMIGIVINWLISEQQRLPRSMLVCIAGLAALPLVYAFGATTNFWPTTSRAGIFWSLASVLVVGCLDQRLALTRMLAVASLTLLIAVGAVCSELERPYRQSQPLRLQTNLTQIDERSSILLSDSASIYVQDLRRLATRHGFRANDFLLDLTGVSPGSQFVLGARPLAAAWTLGGYPGSDRFLAASLEEESCRAIVSSWVLTEPDSRSAYASQVLQRFGIDVARDYVDVGVVASIRTFGPVEFRQHLLKPLRNLEDARALCESARMRPGP